MESLSWQLVPGFDPLWHIWNDEAVIYDRFSGDTHLIDAASAHLIRILAQAPCDEQGLLREMVQYQGDLPHVEFIALIDTRLKGLARLGVIQCLRG